MYICFCFAAEFRLYAMLRAKIIALAMAMAEHAFSVVDACVRGTTSATAVAVTVRQFCYFTPPLHRPLQLEPELEQLRQHSHLH